MLQLLLGHTRLVVAQFFRCQYSTIDQILKVMLFSDAAVSIYSAEIFKPVSTDTLALISIVDSGEDVDIRRKQTRETRDEQHH